MSRTIKFRAWDNIIKKMFIPSMINKDGDVRHTYDGGETWLLKENNSFELMQYTGRADKNGKEIFEGDISMPGTGEIFYCEKTSMFKVRWHDKQWKQIRTPMLDGERLLTNANAFEIVGNIHENPELIKKTDQ